eukprot:768554-Hanusia_phi.AAC.4
MAVPTVRLRNGVEHPLIGYGTYKIGFVPASSNSASEPGHSPDQDPAEIIKDAIACGYRYIDCAQFYGNEKVVGKAISESKVPRGDLFLVSKVWGDKIYEGREAILEQLEQTLRDLGTDYLDIYLVHWPVPGKHVAAYQVLEEALEAGKIRAIGVSNYTREDYEELKAVARVLPVVNQIEVNPFLWRKRTYDYFTAEGVVIQSYRALRQGKEMGNACVAEVAKKHGKTAAQILGRWCVQRNIVLVAKTVHRDRMLENMGVFDFQLDEDDMLKLDSLTTPDSLAVSCWGRAGDGLMGCWQEFKALYDKCVVRDTPLAQLEPSAQGVKKEILLD